MTAAYFHPPQARWREQQKDRLLQEAGIRVIRVKEARETGIDWERYHILCVYRADYLYIDRVVVAILEIIGVLRPNEPAVDLAVNIKADYAAIKQLYDGARQRYAARG